MSDQYLAGIIFCLLFILVIITIFTAKYVQNCNRVRIEILDNRRTGNKEKFTVQNNPNEPEEVGKEVARRLHNLATKGDVLVFECFNRSYPDKLTAERLAKRWRSIRENNALRETAFGEKSAAYTVNKGDELRICIRDPEKDTMFEDENTSMFVLLHEMAHLASKSWGHGVEFKKHFSKLVKAAVDLNIYKYQDFRSSSEDYCGTEITNPAYV